MRTSITFGLYELEDSGPRSHQGQNGVFGYLQKQLVVLRTSCILGDGTDFETRTY